MTSLGGIYDVQTCGIQKHTSWPTGLQHYKVSIQESKLICRSVVPSISTSVHSVTSTCAETSMTGEEYSSAIVPAGYPSSSLNAPPELFSFDTTGKPHVHICEFLQVLEI
jgi:hypothetical protein